MRAFSVSMPVLLAIGLFAVVGVLPRAGVSAVAVADVVGSHQAAMTYFDLDISRSRETSGAVATVEATPSGTTQDGSSLLDDPYRDRQWALGRIRLTGAATGYGRGVLVAILDTGIDSSHEDLTGQVLVEVNLTDSSRVGDVSGHGTHIAGIISAKSGNGRGIAGMAPASHIMSVKIADDDGTAHTTAVARGIRWAVDNGANVINISVEFEGTAADMKRAVDYAWKRGAIIVAAAGNGGHGLPVYPAYYENVIAVAGSTRHDSLAPLSNYGHWVDVVAPGFDLCSTLPNDAYGYRSGTSFAAAYVSGLAAVLFGLAEDGNGNGRVNDEVRAAIEAGLVEFNSAQVGRIDVPNSVDRLRQR